jgi:hypothetical protein
MLKQAILVCALANQAIPFKNPFSVRDFVDEYQTIRLLLATIRPDCDYLFVPNRIHEVPKGYKKEYIQWRGHTIYYKKST